MVIEVPKELAKEKQKEIGEWTEGMDAYLGKRGVVAGVGDSFIEVKMEKEGKVIKWNPKLLQNEELKKFKRNDLVRVLNVPIAKVKKTSIPISFPISLTSPSLSPSLPPLPLSPPLSPSLPLSPPLSPLPLSPTPL